MTKIEELERKKRRWKYFPIISSIIIVLVVFIGCFFPLKGDYSSQIVLIIYGIFLVIVNYLLQREGAKETIRKCDHEIKEERLKLEIKEEP